MQIQLSRNAQGQMINEPLTITVPMLYDMSMNSLQIAGDRNQNTSHVLLMNTISNLLKRFPEYNRTYNC